MTCWMIGKGGWMEFSLFSLFTQSFSPSTHPIHLPAYLLSLTGPRRCCWDQR